MRKKAARAKLGAVLAVVGIVAMAVGVPTLVVGEPPAAPPSVPAGPPAPGPGHAYLGAFVDPSSQPSGAASPTSSSASIDDELSALPAFDQKLHQPLSVVSVHQSWDAPVSAAQLRQVFASGALPLISWGCGASDAAIAAGADDAQISAFAQEVATSAVPILLDWFADPNADSASAALCLGVDGAADYVAAYRHIHALFVAAGAANAGFVWSIDPTAGTPADWASYYPGADVVDWIGADAFDSSSTTPAPNVVQSELAAWYGTFATAGKPLALTTAAVPGKQGAYLTALAAAFASTYPQIEALVYDDTISSGSSVSSRLDVNGLTAFAALSANPYFEPARAGTNVTLSASPTKTTAGQLVTLTAKVAGTDGGGVVSFTTNGSLVPGCATVMLTAGTSTCPTSALSTGADQVVASYTGDANRAGSIATITVTVSAVTITAGGSPASGSTSGRGGPGSVLSSPVRAAPEAPVSEAAGVGTGPVPMQPQQGGPLVPPAGHAYIGGFVDPNGTGYNQQNPDTRVPSLPSELNQLPALEASLPKPLSIVEVATRWDSPELVTRLDQVWASGGIPMVQWGCGPSDSQILANSEDTKIDDFAAKLAEAGMPILLDWFADPNTAGDGTVTGDHAQHCLGSAGVLGYVNAYRYIYERFRSLGVKNVSFVWSVDTSEGTPTEWQTFWPGADSVDWIGADMFQHDWQTSPFSAALDQWYAAFLGYDKPMMLSNVGVLQAAQDDLAGAASKLPLFPLVKALVYFDAPAHALFHHYELDATGMGSLIDLAGLKYFQPPTNPTSVSLTASPTSAATGQTVDLVASVGGSDTGGNLSFAVNGSVIPGCGAVPVLAASSCSTSALPQGQDSITVTYSGDASSGGSASGPVRESVMPSTPSVGPPLIPSAGKAYLGGWIRPEFSGHGPLSKVAADAEEEQNLPGFNSGLARPLAIVHLYQPFYTPLPFGELEWVVAHGETPMVDWTCGDTDPSIIAGTDDSRITAEAEQLKALRAPVFFRWYWEPNFTRNACLGSTDQLTAASDYVTAFRHIHDLFVAAGATNVAFIWTIGASGTQRDTIEYYPGPAYVDWIAADGYDRPGNTGNPDVFVRRFRTWYSEYADFGKPMMISETAAAAAKPDSQAQYLSDIANDVPTEFPLLKGLIYFDAPGNDNRNKYQLDANGLPQFQSLSRDPIFQPIQDPTSMTLSDSVTSIGDPRQAVTLTPIGLTVDGGGAISYADNGAPIPGCQDMPINLGTTCTTTKVPPGQQTITASYSGDVTYQGSFSTVNVAVTGITGNVPVASSPSTPVASSPFTPVAISPFTLVPTDAGIPGLTGLGAAGLRANLPGSVGGYFPFRFNGSGQFPIELLGDPSSAGGVATLFVSIGGALIALLGAYMLVTWLQDRRRRTVAEPPTEST